jgi:hypothetical protein
VRGEIFRTASVALAKLESRSREGARELRFLEQRACRREKDANFAAADSLECLYTLTCDFRVWLDLSEAFARRIESHEAGVAERLQISEPALCS